MPGLGLGLQLKLRVGLGLLSPGQHRREVSEVQRDTGAAEKIFETLRT